MENSPAFSVTPTVHIQNLVVEKGEHPILNGINLSVSSGQVIGVLGHNGSGKTTLLETMLGFLEPTAGHISLWGTAVDNLSATEKHKIAYVPQQDDFPENMTVKDSLRLYGSFYPNWNHPLADELLQHWDIDSHKKIGQLSGGQKQKLSIVHALVISPELIVLDEPVASLDPIARSLFLQQLNQHLQVKERALVISSHIVADLEGFINTLWLLKAGRVLWAGPVEKAAEAVGLPSHASLEQIYRHAMQP